MSIRIGTSQTITGFDSGTLWIYQNHSTLDKKAIQKLRAKGYLFPSYGIDSLKAVSISILIYIAILKQSHFLILKTLSKTLTESSKWSEKKKEQHNFIIHDRLMHLHLGK